MAGLSSNATRGSLTEALKQAAQSERDAMLTMMPARIVRFYGDAQQADVQPMYKVLIGDSEQLPPIITRAPVVFPRAGGFVASWPVQDGDLCHIQIASRSIEEWSQDGQAYRPRQARSFDLSDATVHMGLASGADAYPEHHADRLELRTLDGVTRLSIDPDGQFAMRSGDDEVLMVLSEALGLLAKEKTIVTSGSSSGTYEHDQKDAIQALQSRLDNLRIS